MSFLSIRGYHSYGAIDVTAKQSIITSKSLGFDTAAYHFPCMGKVSPNDQVNQIIAYLGDLPSMYWLDIEENPSTGCQYTIDFNKNCEFLKEVVAIFKATGVKVGIYASAHEWTVIFGGTANCPYFSDLPLWYAHYDNVQAFSDFKPFAGWTKPYTKQYKGTTMLCNVNLDLNWKP